MLAVTYKRSNPSNVLETFPPVPGLDDPWRGGFGHGARLREDQTQRRGLGDGPGQTW